MYLFSVRVHRNREQKQLLGKRVERIDAVPREYRVQSWRNVLREGVTLARSSGIGDEEFVNKVPDMLSVDAEVRP